jgi:hypothetical protein
MRVTTRDACPILETYRYRCMLAVWHRHQCRLGAAWGSVVPGIECNDCSVWPASARADEPWHVELATPGGEQD